MHEAVRVLVVTQVLEVGQSDGTRVRSLEPALLRAGLHSAAELLRDDTLVELTEVRRGLEPAATALAAHRIRDQDLVGVRRHLDAMRGAGDDVELFTKHDVAFHQAVVTATGNATLATLLQGISNRTMPARVWHGLVEDDAGERAIAEHEAIYAALAARNAPLAEKCALLHVGTTAEWLREHLHHGEAVEA